MRPLRFCLVSAIASLLLCSLSLAQTSPDFVKAHDEALKFLMELVKIDTSNPPGNEVKAAEYIKGVLAAEGITARSMSRRRDAAT